ncbi:hypothetical protein K469DRAFT_577154, partial [Zopfia rhizophila CBS 207.26]
VGGVIYATDLLERALRGTFHIPGASHQVMHVVVIFGAWIYREGILSFQAHWGSRELLCS